MLAVLAPALGYAIAPGNAGNQQAYPSPLAPGGPGVIEPPFAWSLTTGVAYSDNINRSPDAQSEEVATADLTILAHEERPRLYLDVTGDIQYREYLQHTYGSTPVGAAAGVLRYTFLPGVFSWMASDNYGQVAGDAFSVQTPANRESVNVVQTGPDITIPLNARNQLILQGRGTEVTVQGDASNSYRQLLGAATLRHRLSRIFSVGLSYSHSSVDYKQISQYPNYSVQEYFADLSVAGPRTTISLDAGYSQLKELGLSNGGSLVRLSLTRKVGSRSTIQVQAGREFSDSAGILQGEQSFSGVTLQNAGTTGINDPVRSKFALASWSTAGVRTTTRVSLTWRKEQHEISTLYDLTLKSVDLEVGYRLTPRILIAGSAVYTANDFRNALVNSKELDVTGSVTVRLQQRLSWTTRVGRYSGDGFLGQGQAYHEDRLFTGISWKGK